MGGKDHEGLRTDSIEVYKCRENKWRATGAVEDQLRMRKPRSGFAAILIKEESKVMVIGGNDGRV